ncbi:hypothetical protein SteCoe_8572 [Stentor coeruleus]|uniref:Uncharacterized protein n=1 Tax=Stentor coeruleus TaxID=5963 RepID=A0A1R2CJY9_9CILI|nr:hypothetical protein SteCoe_8572 [Stentor coeruleus]
MFFALLLLSVTGEMFYSFDSMLDPLHIKWPKNWVSNMVEPSSNHAGETVSINVYCYVPITLPIGTYVELTVKGLTTATKSYNLAAEQKSTDDNTFTFTGYVLPSTAGSYGPISIVIRQSSTGQILAASEVLGVLGVTSSKPTAGSLSVTWGTASKIISASSSLTFSFSLTASMDEYDFFVLNTDSNFPFTTLTGPTWAEDASGTTYFSSMGVDAQKDSNKVVFYGLQTPVYEDVTGTFTLTGFTNPDYVKSGSGYSWSLEVYRFGTKTILQRFTSTQPSDSTVAGAITISSWTPSNSYLDKSDIVLGLSTFMTVKFSGAHTVTSGGYFDITFSAGVSLSSVSYVTADADQVLIDGGTGSEYIYAEPVSSISCSIAVQVVTCTVKDDQSISAGTQISLYTLVLFGSSPSISSIKSYNKDAKMIDTTAAAESITYSATTSKVLLANAPVAYITTSKSDATSLNTVGTNGNSGLVVSFLADGSITTSSSFSISAPLIIQDSATEFSLGFASSVYGIYPSTNTQAVFTTTTFATTAGITPQLNSGTLSFTSPIAYTDATHYVNLYFGAGSSGTPGKVYMPNFETGLQARHEFAIKYTISTKTYVWAKPLYFISATSDPAFLFYCKDSPAPGLPAKLSITPAFAWTIDSAYTAYIIFEITTDNVNIGADFGSGLDSLDEYPAQGVGLSDTLFIYYTEDSTAINLYYEFGSATVAASAMDIIIPIPSLTDSVAYTVDACIVAQRDADEAVFYLSKTSTQAAISASSSVLTPTDSSPSTTATFSTLGSMASVGLPLTGISAGAVTKGASLSFDKGFAFGSSPTINGATTGAKSLSLLVSSNPKFEFVTGYLTDSAGIAFTDVASSSSTSWVLNSATASWFASSAKAYLTIGSSPSGFADAVCYNYEDFDFTISPASMTLANYDPKSTKGLGADSFTFDLTISLTTPGAIYALDNSKITFIVGSSFAATGCAWTLTAGTFSDSGTLGSNTGTTTKKLTSNIDASTNIVITVKNIPRIAYVDDSTKYSGFTSVTVYYDTNEVYKWTDSSDDSKTTLTTGTTYGKSNIASVMAFPNAKGSNGVYFQITFKPAYALPAGSEITIEGESFSADTLVTDNTWCNYGFSTASITNSKLVLTISSAVASGATVEVRKDLAFDISSSASSTSSSFLVTAKYLSTTIVQDALADAKTVQQIAYSSAATPVLSSVTVTPSMTNMGLVSSHKFTFKASTDILEDWMICFDAPADYDAYPGPVEDFELLPSVFFLEVESDASDYVICYADHWVISCGGFGQIASGTEINVYITLLNPVVTSTTWSIYVVDSTGTLVVAPYYSLAAAYTSIPSSTVDLYTVSHDSEQGYSQNIEFVMLATESFSASGAIYVQFPGPYDLEVYNPNSVTCSGVYETDTPTNFIPEGSECAVYGNWVEFILPSAQSLTANYWTTLTAEEIVQPADGFSRSKDNYDAYIDTLFDVYDYWTGKFKVLTISGDSTAATAFTGMSVCNLNAAYTGYFYQDWDVVDINGGEDLIVIPGTFSEYYLIAATDLVLNALELLVYAKDENDDVLKLDSDSYQLTNSYPFDIFRVGVPIETVEGFYYITWDIKETPFQSGVYNYGVPPKTTVQVFSDESVSVTTSEISLVPIGLFSYPIEIFLDGVSPFSDITISLALDTSSTLYSFEPESLTFTSSDFSKSFVIKATSEAVDGTKVTFSYSISGTDKDAFEIDSSASFTIGSINTASAVITSLDLVEDGSNSLDLVINIDTASVVTWALMASNVYDNYDNVTDYDYIMNTAYPLVGDPTDAQVDIYDQTTEFSATLESITGDDWDVISRSITVMSLQTYFTGQSFVDSGTSTIYSFTSLIASSDYVAVVWADNFSGSDLAYEEAEGTTGDLSPPAIVTLTFDDVIPSGSMSAVNKALALTFKVNSLRVKTFGGITRRLGSTSSSVLASSVMTPEKPSDVANSVDNDVLLVNLNAQGVVTTGVSLSATDATYETFGTPGFTDPEWNNTDVEFVFSFTADVNGIFCCGYQVDSNSTYTSSNLVFGINSDGEDISDSAWCYDASEGESYTFTLFVNETGEVGTFDLACTICNAYPILPECLTDENLEMSSIEWLNETDSYGRSLVMAIVALIAYLS